MTQPSEFDKVAKAFEQAFTDAVKAKLEKLTAKLEREAKEQDPLNLGPLFAPPPKWDIPKDVAAQLDAESTKAELLYELPNLDTWHPHDRERIERIIDGTRQGVLLEGSWRQLISRAVRQAADETKPYVPVQAILSYVGTVLQRVLLEQEAKP